MNRTLACPSDDNLKSLLKGNLSGPLVELLASHLENCSQCGKRAEQFRMEDEYAALLHMQKERPLTPQEAQELAELRSRMLSLKETLTNASNATLVNPGNSKDTPRELIYPGQLPAKQPSGAAQGGARWGIVLGVVAVIIVGALLAGWWFWLR
jgi:hypothetical protein